jgi:hypothetical protein
MSWMFIASPITSRLPSGVNATSFVLTLSSESSSLPVAASHRHVVPSLPALGAFHGHPLGNRFFKLRHTHFTGFIPDLFPNRSGYKLLLPLKPHKPYLSCSKFRVI